MHVGAVPCTSEVSMSPELSPHAVFTLLNSTRTGRGEDRVGCRTKWVISPAAVDIPAHEELVTQGFMKPGRAKDFRSYTVTPKGFEMADGLRTGSPTRPALTHRIAYAQWQESHGVRRHPTRR